MVHLKEMNCMVHELYLNEPINKAIYNTTSIKFFLYKTILRPVLFVDNIVGVISLA